MKWLGSQGTPLLNRTRYFGRVTGKPEVNWRSQAITLITIRKARNLPPRSQSK